jgi:hypothetical protein
MAGLDFHSRAQRLVALEFLQRRAHVGEAIGEEERGREEKWEKKEFHEAYDNAFVERFKPEVGGQRSAHGESEAPSTRETSSSKLQTAQGTSLWSLVIGASLMLGCWSFELFLAAGTRADGASNRRRFVAGAKVADAQSDDVPAKIAEGGLGVGYGIEQSHQLAGERLFGDVAALIEGIKCVSEAIVKARQTRDFFPKEFL